MATSPLRGFTDLSRYQQAAVQPQPNIMDQFVQALNQGISLGQLPQTLQAEAQQRQQQSILDAIKVATAQKQWEELNKPYEQKLAEEFERSLAAQSYARGSGVARLSPDQLTPEQLSIFEGGVPLAAPGAITPEQYNLLKQREAGVQAGGIPLQIPTAPLGTPVVPMLTPRGVPTQFSFDPSIPAAVKEKARAQELANIEAEEAAKGRGKLPFEQAKIKAEEAAKGTKQTPLAFSTEGNKRIGRNPFTGAIVSETVIPAGKVDIKTDRGLFIGNPDDANSFKLVPGTEPIPEPAAGVKPPAEMVNRYTKFGGVLKNIDELEKKVNDLVKTKKFPDAIQRAISTEVSVPPTGFVNSLYQSALKNLQSGDAKSLEATRAQVAESILTTLAGLAQTGIELRNLAPFTPQSGEPLPDLINKMNSLKSFVNNERLAVEQQFPGIKTGTSSLSTPPPTEAGITSIGTFPTVTTKQQYDALPSGSQYIGKNGKLHQKP